MNSARPGTAGSNRRRRNLGRKTGDGLLALALGCPPELTFEAT